MYTLPLKSITCTDSKTSLNSVPKHPEFIFIPPPTEPGIQDKNSNPPRLFSQAKSEHFFLSKIEQPAIIILFLVNDILLKFLPNLMNMRFLIFSEINKFEPAPITKKSLSFFHKFLKIS